MMDTIWAANGHEDMTTKEMGYRSFLLRLWCVKRNSEHTLRASLEDPRSGQKYFFTNMETLNEFLANLVQVLEGEAAKQGG